MRLAASVRREEVLKEGQTMPKQDLVFRKSGFVNIGSFEVQQMRITGRLWEECGKPTGRLHE